MKKIILTLALFTVVTIGATSRVSAQIDPIKNLTSPTQSELPLPPEPKPDPPKPKIIKYKTVANDNLTKISKQFNVSVERIFDKNTQLSDPNILKVDEELTIPSKDEKLTERTNTPVTPKVGSVPIKSSSGANLYDKFSCTWWVKNWKPEVGNWGNANQWGYAAQSEGWTVSPTPVVGAVAWSTRGKYGHVGLVVGLGNGTIILKEGNYDWNGSVRTVEVPVSQYRYIYR